MWRKAVMCHNVSVYTALYSVYLAIYSAAHGIHFADMVFAQAHSKHCSGCAHLELNLLKPSWIEFTQDTTPNLTLPDGEASCPMWLEYVYRTAHPALCWLPLKLAEWIGENLQDELGFPDKADRRSEPGSCWTPAELNDILQAHVVEEP
jgi:hypothetical protein